MYKKLLRQKCVAFRSQNVKASFGALVFLCLFVAGAGLFAVPMGLGNMLNTMMNTAYQLLMNTALYIMAIAVLAGAFAALLTEFGVVALINKILSPLMHPVYGMPGAAAIGIVTTFLSDNPAILALAKDARYRRFFKTYQIPALTNLGTAFGMGLIVTTYMLGIGPANSHSLIGAVICGNLGAVAGSVMSTRLMLMTTEKALGKTEPASSVDVQEQVPLEKARDPVGIRLIDAILRGGKTGVEMGLGIIPGVLIICTIVMMLTNGPSESGKYTGAAFEGIRLLPMLADRCSFLLKPLFGFSSSECLAVPVTALGSAGAALGIAGTLFSSGAADAGDIAVFTAMCMCWSGYLSTHVSMMDVLQCRHFSGKSILWHSLGGLLAGAVAHWLFVLVEMIP